MPLTEKDKEGRTVTNVFPTRGGGYGYGITREGIGGESFPEGYDHAVNMLDLGGRIFTPAPAASARFSLIGKQPPQQLFNWYDTSLIPYVVVLHDTGVKIFKNGAVTAEADATTAEYGSGAFWDDGTNPLFVAGTKTGSKLLNKRTQAGVWTAAASNTGIFCASTGDKFWATANDYQIKNWAAGSDPTSAAASATIRVGNQTSKITSVGLIGAKPLVGKEDGVWAYNEQSNRFDPIYPASKHRDNFKIMKSDGQGGLLTAEHGGDLVRFYRYGNIVSYSPLRDKRAWRDTPRPPIVDLDVRGEHIYVLQDNGYKFIQKEIGLILALTTDGGSTYTIDTENVVDQRFDTTFSISSLADVSGNDWVILGANVPFLAIDLTMDTVSSATARLKVRRVVGWSGGVPTSQQDFGITDGTDTTPETASTPFGQSGRISFRPDTGVAVATTWVASTASLNGVDYSRYWAQICLE